MKGAKMSLPSGLNCNLGHQLAPLAACAFQGMHLLWGQSDASQLPLSGASKDSRSCVGHPLQLGLCPLGQCPKSAPQS